MIASITSFAPPPSVNDLQARFQSLLPRIEICARYHFRRIQCPDSRADRIAETIAMCWKWFVCLAERGEDGAGFITTIASLAARAVQSGRRVCGQESAKDVMSWSAQRRHGFRVESLPRSTRRAFDDVYAEVGGQQAIDAYEERLQDNTATPPPDAAAFRIDFPDWLGTRTSRDRKIIARMVLDERTQDLSRRFGVSPGRISQLRREYHEDWQRFHGEAAVVGGSA